MKKKKSTQGAATRVTQAEFARREHVTKQAVSKWVSLGLPIEAGGMIDPRKAARWLLTRTTRRGRTKHGAETYADARSRKESALATTRELELKLLQEKMGDIQSLKGYRAKIELACIRCFQLIPFQVVDFLRSAYNLDDQQCRVLDSRLTELVKSSLHDLLPRPPGDSRSFIFGWDNHPAACDSQDGGEGETEQD